jgi:hypothetical protein
LLVKSAITVFSFWANSGGRWSGSRDVDLAGTTPWTLAWDDDAPNEHLSAPNTPGLLALDRAGQALGPDGAVDTKRLRVLDVLGTLGEEQLRVIATARKLVPEELEGLDKCSELHLTHLLSCLDLVGARADPVVLDPTVCCWRNSKAADPLSGSAA